MAGSNTVYSSENQSSAFYKPLKNGLVYNLSKLYTCAMTQTTDDMVVRSSADGVTWATEHTYNPGVNESGYNGPYIVMDADNYIHVFTIYNDSVLGYRLKHSTDRSGSWVTSDITSEIGDATTTWANLQITVFNDSGTQKAFLFYHDSATPTHKVCLLNLEDGTADWTEDALDTDSGGSISQYFASGVNGYWPTGLDDPVIFYNNGTTAKYAIRTGTGTWTIANLTFGTARTRTDTPRFVDCYTTNIGVTTNLVAMEFYLSGSQRHEVFFWNGAGTLTTDGYFTSGTLVTQNLGCLTGTQDGEYHFYVPCSGLGGQRWIEKNTRTGGTWASACTVLLGSGASADPDYQAPRPLAMHPQRNFDHSYAKEGQLFIYHKATLPATYESMIYYSEASVDAMLPEGGVATASMEYSTYTISGAGFNGPYAIASMSYGYATASGAGEQGPITPTGVGLTYLAYTATGTGKTPNASDDAVVDYPLYDATGVGINTVGGLGNDYETVYDAYTATGVGAIGALGTGSLTYPSYTATGSHFWGSGSGSYGAYTISATTPGAATETDFTGSGAVTYRAYTISVVALGNIQGSGSVTGRAYVASGTGIHSAAATGIAAYSNYQALGWAITGSINLGTGEIVYSSYTITAAGMIDDIVGTSTATYPNMYVEATGTHDHLEVFTGRLVDHEGQAFVDGDGNFIIIQSPTPAEYEVVFVAMNIPKKAVTEYTSFNFNSIDRVGHGKTIYAANSDGLYILGEDSDDDGVAISSNVEKLQHDYDSGQRKRSTDAYVYLKSDGSYTFSSVADGGRSDVTVTDTDTLEHTRKIDLAKGLIGRGLGWGFRADGTEYEIEEVELVMGVGSRRSKRYGG